MTSSYYQNLNRRVMAGARQMFPPAFPRTSYDRIARGEKRDPAAGVVPIMLTSRGKATYFITRWGQVVRKSTAELWMLSKLLRDRLEGGRLAEREARATRQRRRERRRMTLNAKRRNKEVINAGV